jgi:hypothetical protein
MNLKKPGFGGPNSAIELRDAKGTLKNKNPKLGDFRRTVERDPAFSHPVYDPTYKAMTHDLVYKQEKKKPFTYADPYHTGIPVVELEPVEEGKAYSSFQRFVNEDFEDEMRGEDTNYPDHEFSYWDEAWDKSAQDKETVFYFKRNMTDEEWDDFKNKHLEDIKIALMENRTLWESFEEDLEDEEYRAEATQSNRTFSDIRQIEDKLRRFEQGEVFDEEESFGSNPDESPFGEIPDWVKELEANQEEEIESDSYDADGNPNGSCSECGDSD